MNKQQFLASVAEKAGMKQAEAANFYDAFVATVQTALSNKEKVQLVGFGTFELKEKAARQGINPATKAAISIPASKAPAFKAGNAFKELFN